MMDRLEMTPAEIAAHERASKIRLGDALDAIRKSLANPDDTAQVIRFIGSVAGRSPERFMRRFIETPHGLEILRRPVALFDVLQDRDRLRALPEGTLGRAYAEWTDREQISAAGLKAESEASARGDYEPTGPYSVLGARVRDCHDLVHVVTGYGRDLVGELGVLAFTYAQTRHRGVGLIILIAYVRSFFGRRDVEGGQDRAVRRTLRSQFLKGLRRGRRAGFILGADWEALMERPLDEVRRDYGIDAPPEYNAIRSQGAPALGSEAVAG